MHKATCEQCHKEFESNYANRKFCSRICYSQYLASIRKVEQEKGSRENEDMEYGKLKLALRHCNDYTKTLEEENDSLRAASQIGLVCAGCGQEISIESLKSKKIWHQGCHVK